SIFAALGLSHVDYVTVKVYLIRFEAEQLAFPKAGIDGKHNLVRRFDLPSQGSGTNLVWKERRRFRRLLHRDGDGCRSMAPASARLGACLSLSLFPDLFQSDIETSGITLLFDPDLFCGVLADQAALRRSA